MKRKTKKPLSPSTVKKNGKNLLSTLQQIEPICHESESCCVLWRLKNECPRIKMLDWRIHEKRYIQNDKQVMMWYVKI
ncbi:hypothetical protein LXL04_037529 [Taraxacum kok-saghyz]